MVVGRIVWTALGRHAGPDLARDDWAVGKLVRKGDTLVVHVAATDDLCSLTTPREFQIALALTLEAQKSSEGLSSVIHKVQGLDRRILSGLSELGAPTGELYIIKSS